MDFINYLKTVTPSTGSGQALSAANGLAGINKRLFDFGCAQAKGFLRSDKLCFEIVS